MSIQELKNPLTDEYIYLKNMVLGEKMAWFLGDTVPESKNLVPFLSHVVIQRPDCNAGNLYSKVYSDLIDYCDVVLKQIFFHNNIPIQYFLRINFNTTLPLISDQKSTQPHVDHEFYHKNLIIYLNNSDGETITCDDNGKNLESSKPEEDKIVIFSGKHYHKLPTKNRRVVMVCTFV